MVFFWHIEEIKNIAFFLLTFPIKNPLTEGINVTFITIILGKLFGANYMKEKHLPLGSNVCYIKIHFMLKPEASFLK